MTKRYYCTGFKSNTHNPCCKAHDNAYGINGPLTGRKKADEALRRCFISNGMHPALAWGAYFAVRWFGWTIWYWHRRRHLLNLIFN
ncbi:hypothetical protein IS481_12095 [Caldimonas thermodepolymerans]|uniref:Uncharacterized protein n=1 Tax=Caldimonas thermodepolymerans TaxID=215580 RepID=A0A2S5T9W6_9BURK|nr:hypothetical protein [Caldimonas thermodepolymerans]PPE71749.1 hypothetical protein C1702_00320 [Caldimonas thermodepolymerans]QPC30511.1 hypothetical protein IS481_12095 [Caldimonas thermodepolymerans]